MSKESSKRLKIGLAVSGGPDSMGMAAQVLSMGIAKTADFLAVVVDHCLRDNSSNEALGTARALENAGLHTEVLGWQKPTGLALHGKLRAARWARYALLADAAKRHSLDRIWVAHTIEDQWETVQMRLNSGTSLRGLAGLSARYRLFDVLFERPWLAEQHRVLKNAASDLFDPKVIVSDPTNLDPKTWRGGHRAQWGRGGVRPDTGSLLETANSLGRWRHRIESDAMAVGSCDVFTAEQARERPFVTAVRLGHHAQFLAQREWPIAFDRALEIVNSMALQGEKGKARSKLTQSGTILIPESIGGQKAWRLKCEADSRAASLNAKAPNRFWHRLFQDASELSHTCAIPPQLIPFAIAQSTFDTTLYPNPGDDKALEARSPS